MPYSTSYTYASAYTTTAYTYTIPCWPASITAGAAEPRPRTSPKSAWHGWLLLLLLPCHAADILPSAGHLHDTGGGFRRRALMLPAPAPLEQRRRQVRQGEGITQVASLCIQRCWLIDSAHPRSLCYAVFQTLRLRLCENEYAGGQNPSSAGAPGYPTWTAATVVLCLQRYASDRCVAVHRGQRAGRIVPLALSFINRLSARQGPRRALAAPTKPTSSAALSSRRPPHDSPLASLPRHSIPQHP